MRRFTAGAAGAALALLGLVACTGPPGEQAAAPAPDPPPPPAACLLALDALAAATGLSWNPDPTTASDTRCVYDPAGDGGAFLAVELAPVDGDPAAVLERVAEVCDGTAERAGAAALVCGLDSGGVYGAAATDGRLVTLAASAVPDGTTAAGLTAALAEQLALLGG